MGRHFAVPPRRRNFMIERRFFVSELIAFGLSVAILPFASSSKSFAAPALAALDKDNDGTLDLAEVKAAAASVFDKLDKDSDATLDSKEIGGRAGKKEFKEADPDHDGTLTKDEYLGLVEKLFNAADADKDGTLTAKDLKSMAGRSLLRLIQP
jgi:Ca2+-binding EF-hand superfamily protein